MAATVKDEGNDTKQIESGIKDLDGDLKTLQKTVDDIKKAQAAILKKPDECRKNFEALYGLIGGLGQIAKDMEKTCKDVNKAIKK
ncbi:MAG: hypothetical protein JOZ05_20440 [Acetobacteraceae bacterium]|nr:hypothetical protein [Acetobacteraceae bacterium]